MSIHLSNKRNFILITSHKCAYTTVLKSNKVHLLLRKRFFKWLYYFLYLSLYRNKTYMLLRNPYERIRSCYFDKVLNCKILPGKSNKFLKLMVSVDGFNFVITAEHCYELAKDTYKVNILKNIKRFFIYIAVHRIYL